MKSFTSLRQMIIKYILLICAFSMAIGAIYCSSFVKNDKPDQVENKPIKNDEVSINGSVHYDKSKRLIGPNRHEKRDEKSFRGVSSGKMPRITVPKGSAVIEQTSQGRKPAASLVTSFDGLGKGFRGPQGWIKLHNPSDNSLAVGPNHIVQIVNTRIAIFTKEGQKFNSTGKVLAGPIKTRNVFRGFGGPCEQQNNGDAVIRYDQLANRWLIVMPIFSRIAKQVDRPMLKAGEPAKQSIIGQQKQPGEAKPMFVPPPDTSQQIFRHRPGRQNKKGSYAMCYAVSTGSNPMGSYYRYEFVRQHFPDYPRPAIWPDGYYVPTSAGDNVAKKQACVADRKKMLKGEKATEQCVLIDGVNFLNNVDLEGKQLPPKGAANIMMAAGGTQLKGDFESNKIYAWKYYVDWSDPSKTMVKGPQKVDVAPYHYLCDGQLTNCVPQPGTDTHLDAQGDKIMSRLVYRKIGDQESIVGVHSVNTSSGGGGVRWYEFWLNGQRNVKLYQQGTYAPDHHFRWLGSPAIDKKGNIGIGFSFGGTPYFAGQRFAGRTPSDPKGKTHPS